MTGIDSYEEHSLQLKEKEETIKSMGRQIDDLKRRAEQGSQQTQGEALEVELEELLQQTFPQDNIHAIGKGVHGADIIQEVCEPAGCVCGTILWESKNTKNWSKDWLSKLRTDQREAKADLAVLTSIALPSDVHSFQQIEGVWVTNRSYITPLAEALRCGLVELGQLRRASDGKHDKMSLLYDYLTGPEFRQRIEAIVEVFQEMRGSISKQRASMSNRQ